VARHSSPPRRHALETRSPVHRRTAVDNGGHRAADAALPRRRGTVITVAGGALSLAGASAAGWVATTQLPHLLDLVLQSEAAPTARTVTLVGLGTPEDDEAPTEQLAAVDPAAVVASATRAATPSKPAAAPAAPRAAAPPPSTPAHSGADQNADDQDDDADSTKDTSQESSDKDSSKKDASDKDSSDEDSSDKDSSERGGNADNDGGSSSSDSDSKPSTDSTDDDESAGATASDKSDQESGSGSGSGTSSSTSTSTGATGLDSRISPGLPTNTGPVSGDLPSELIDTKDWYLTLPTGKQGSPDLVEGSALAKYHSEFFQLNPAKDGVVFTAGTNGVTTSGSHYPRSELREMVGSDKASWDGRKGKHTMEIVEAITETPKAKPDVIAGQIHGTTDDLMQIHLSGQNLRVKYADGQKFVDLDPNYKLGTMFNVKIESAGGRVKVWYNGQQKADLPISSATSYFKAGAYVNSNPSKGDKSGEGQVVIKSLAVRHE
jgi:hypothetical protein